MTLGNDWNAQFLSFHRANPHVYHRLVELARQWRSASPGQRVGIELLFAVLRWEEIVATTGDRYRLNSAYRAHYARLIMHRENDLADIFETRASCADIFGSLPAQQKLWDEAAGSDDWLDEAAQILDRKDDFKWPPDLAANPVPGSGTDLDNRTSSTPPGRRYGARAAMRA